MKKFLISIIFTFHVLILFGQYTVTLQLQESLSGGCGVHSNCVTHTICYDLIATPNTNGAWLASYDIWYVINGGSMNPNALYQSDGTCIITNNSDLPATGATTFIRVGATGGTPDKIINGPTLIHNFCMTYTTLAQMNGSTLVAGGSFGSFNSNMSVNVNNTPTNAVIVPSNLVINQTNTSCFTLPVRWLSFEAAKKGETSLLTWSTADESNNAGFIIENSLDGIHFNKIGEVSATADPGAINSYSFTDLKPYGGKNYYRLQQYDWDGNRDFSPIRTVSFSSKRFEAIAWPNPVNDVLNIQIQGNESDIARIKLYSSTGQIVLQQQYESSIQSTTLDISRIESGLYTLMIESGGNTHIEKIVVLK